jgi:hypothetical protein
VYYYYYYYYCFLILLLGLGRYLHTGRSNRVVTANTRA